MAKMSAIFWKRVRCQGTKFIAHYNLFYIFSAAPWQPLTLINPSLGKQSICRALGDYLLFCHITLPKSYGFLEKLWKTLVSEEDPVFTCAACSCLKRSECAFLASAGLSVSSTVIKDTHFVFSSESLVDFRYSNTCWQIKCKIKDLFLSQRYKLAKMLEFSHP